MSAGCLTGPWLGQAEGWRVRFPHTERTTKGTIVSSYTPQKVLAIGAVWIVGMLVIGALTIGGIYSNQPNREDRRACVVALASFDYSMADIQRACY